MRSLLVDFWIRMRASYWFLPSCMVAASIGLAWAMVFVDAEYANTLARARLGWLLTREPEGARLILSTIAGSMITVAGVTFSMTLLLVSHASGQIGPRLIAGFMRDRGNQLTLGTFVSTFLYCLLVLRAVRGPGEGEPGFIPNAAVLVALLMAASSVFVLVYFIHHVPQMLNMSNVIAGVGDQIVARVREEFPSIDADRGDDFTPGRLNETEIDWTTAGIDILYDSRGGYVRVLDYSGLVELAEASDMQFIVRAPPGSFVSRGRPLLRAHPAGSVTPEIEEEARSAFTCGNERTPEQDILFLVDQLCEVACRALSPGVNDPYTAITCIDQFERALATLVGRSAPDENYHGAKGALRLTRPRVEFGQLVDRIFIPLRQVASDDGLVSWHLMKMVERVLQLDLDTALVERIIDQTRLFASECLDRLPTAAQRERFREAQAEFTQIVDRLETVRTPQS